MTTRAQTDGDALTASLQSALAGEHAAVWAHGRAAAELAGAQRSRALDQLDGHRVARDALRVRIRAAGAEPVPAAAAYLEPFPVTGAGTARRLLAHVEDALAATYADVTAATPPGARASAMAASIAAARRAFTWDGASRAFPGAG